MSRKGITPVIAVVLLLLITVGAVASAWGLYQSITSDTGQLDQLNARQRAQQTSFAYRSMYEDSDGNASVEMVIENTGDRTVNLSDEFDLYVSPPGETGWVLRSALSGRFSDWHVENNNCFNSSAPRLDKGNTYTCDTGVAFPNATQTVRFRISYKGLDNYNWENDCYAQTSQTSTC